jgi:hypothetical protein
MALRGRCTVCGTDLVRRWGYIEGVLMIHEKSFVYQSMYYL